MGAQVLHAIICWALLSKTGESKQLQSVNSSVVKDSAGAGSVIVPKLYQNVRIGPYAAPFNSYSYQPVATSHVAFSSASAPRPIIQHPAVFKDSYGQFVKPQMGYLSQPQQFLQIQALPAHLSQPLAANAPVYQYQTAPRFFNGPQFSISGSTSGYTAAVAPTTHTDSEQPKVYSESFRTFVPSSTRYTYGSTYPTSDASTTSSSPITVPSTTPKIKPTDHHESASEIQDLSKTLHNHKNKTFKNKFNKKDAKPQQKDIDSHNIQSQTKITAIVNGEPTTVTLETTPPLPLLDLSLLEPLTFDTPLVTQMQHFLPKLASATYHKLPDFSLEHDDDEDDDDSKKHKHQEIIVEHTKTYDTGPMKVKNHKAKKPQTEKPPARNGPEIKYEINTPNHKEIIKEEVVSYKKETNPEPIHYSYGDEKHDKPKVYSYVHNSQEPLAVTRVNYHNNNNEPKQFFSSAELQAEHESSKEPQEESGESNHSGESSAESNADHPPLSHTHNNLNDDSQHKSYHRHPENKHYSEHHNHGTDHEHSQEDSHSHSDEDSSGETHSHAALREKPNKHYNRNEDHKKPQASQKNRQQDKNQRHSKQQFHVPQQSAKYQSKPYLVKKPQFHHIVQKDTHNHHHPSSPPRSSQYRADHKQISKPNKVEHGQQQNNPNQQIASAKPMHLQYYTPQTMKLAMSPNFLPVHPDWTENMRLFNMQNSHAAIKVDPDQHVQYGPTTPRIIRMEHISVPQTAAKFSAVQRPYISNPTHVHEKSKKIIIKDESPAELHMHAEQLMEQMIGQEENDEEGFEKAYKQAAVGFPGFDDTEDELEKDIFNPDSYGVPHDHQEFKIEDSPFEKYQKEGDVFPKSARLSYKDSADDTKEDYFLDYSVSKPESFLNHHNHKANYYKLYKKQRPDKIFTIHNNKNHKPEKYVASAVVAAPSFNRPIQKQFYSFNGRPGNQEFDYSTKSLHHNSGLHSLPTFYGFVQNVMEPQLQFGAYSHLRPVYASTDVAALASNTPKSEKPTRKKLYKENWYIKKTTTGAKNR